MITRRSFLSKSSLGGAAALLAPMVGGFLREAYGQAPTRQLALFYVVPDGFHRDWEFLPDDLKGKTIGPEGTTTYQWPTAFAPLEPFRNRMLLVDGLKNNTTTESHATGFLGLACMRNDAVEFTRRPLFAAGPTIDQYIAETLGRGTAFPSVRFGAVGDYFAPTRSSVFAFGKDAPAPHILDPLLYHRTLFSGVTGGATPEQSKSDTLLLDTITGQIKRLQGKLAGPEREKLGAYLAAIEQIEKRQTTALKCMVPPAPAPLPNSAGCKGNDCKGPKPSENGIEAMMSMSLIAAICGMTNVICVSDGGPGGHGSQTHYSRIVAGTQFAAAGFVMLPEHEGENLGRPMRQIVRRYQTGVLADAARTLSGVKVGDRTLFDQTAMILISENGDDHHANHNECVWPLLLIGNAGGKLRADGRFINYNRRPLGDFFSTLATALGRPTTGFGDANVPQGPIAGLLA
jgi:hypothetical protein